VLRVGLSATQCLAIEMRHHRSHLMRCTILWSKGINAVMPVAQATWPCLFQLFSASGHQKLLQTAKCPAFQPAFMRITLVKIVSNQREHIIGGVVAIVGNRHFLHPKPYGLSYLPPYIISTILRFSEKLLRKKLNQTGRHYAGHACATTMVIVLKASPRQHLGVQAPKLSGLRRRLASGVYGVHLGSLGFW
jgi:hypothetical protein